MILVVRLGKSATKARVIAIMILNVRGHLFVMKKVAQMDHWAWNVAESQRVKQNQNKECYIDGMK